MSLRSIRPMTRVALTATILIGSLQCAHPLLTSAQPQAAPESRGRDDDRRGSDARVRVATYNIHHAAGNDACEPPPVTSPPSAECALNLERIAHIVRGFKADVVALQEVDRFWGRSGTVDQANALGAMVDMSVCYGGNLDHQADSHASRPHQYGTLILTKAPLIACWNTLLPRANPSSEQRGLLHAVVDVRGTPFHVYNTHLHTALADRAVQVPAVDALIGETTPSILLGDLNAQPTETTLAPLQARFQDAWLAGSGTGDGFTIPAAPDAPPTRRIDYGFATNDIAVRRAEVDATEQTALAADHYPVIFELQVPRRRDR